MTESEKKYLKSIYDKNRYELKKEELLEASRNWYAKNKERKKYQYRENRMVYGPKKWRDQSKSYYKRYPEKCKQNREKWRRKRNAEWHEFIKDHGLNKCSRCGYSESFVALDFHHINPENKKKEIGQIFNRYITPERIEEISKCIVLCSNCHRIIHYEAKCQQIYGENHERRI